MAIRRLRNSVTISGDDLSNVKQALKKALRPASDVPPGYAQCPGCKKILIIVTSEQRISGTCDPCWDRMFSALKDTPGEDTGDEAIPF